MTLRWHDAPTPPGPPVDRRFLGRELHLDGAVVGRTHYDADKWRSMLRWYWACPAVGRVKAAHGAADPFRKASQAERACEAHVRSCLGMAQQR